MAYIKLLRPKDWAKNLFLFIPLFFSGQLFQWHKYPWLFLGFLAFCCVASSIYIINDYLDIEDDKKHPEKSSRPLAAGTVSKKAAIILSILLLIAGFGTAFLIKDKFVFILGVYFLLNLSYSFGLKTISILDIIIIAIGFVLRVKAGAVIIMVGMSEWLTIMVFLLALFMAIGKRSDDVLHKMTSGTSMRKSIQGYNLELLNVLLALVCAVMVVAYFMYTVSQAVEARLGTYRLYYTSIFVIAGIMRYLQLIYVKHMSGSPTRILYKDRFIQISIFLWIISFYFIIYTKDIIFFKK